MQFLSDVICGADLLHVYDALDEGLAALLWIEIGLDISFSFSITT